MSSTDIEARFATLERRNKWLTMFCLSFGIVIIVAPLQGQAKPNARSEVPDKVVTKSLILVDKNGAERGTWVGDMLRLAGTDSSVYLTSKGVAGTYKEASWRLGRSDMSPTTAPPITHLGLVIFRNHGSKAISIAEEKGNGVILAKARNGHSVMLSASDDHAGVGLANSKGRLQTHLYVSDKASAFLLDDENGGERITLFADNDDASISLKDAEQRERMFLTVANDRSRVVLTDAGNEVRAVFGSHRTIITDKDQTTSKPESAISLFDKDGNVMWEAP